MKKFTPDSNRKLPLHTSTLRMRVRRGGFTIKLVNLCCYSIGLAVFKSIVIRENHADGLAYSVDDFESRAKMANASLERRNNLLVGGARIH